MDHVIHSETTLNKRKISTLAILGLGICIVSTSIIASDFVTLEVEAQVLDLDTGAVSDVGPENPSPPTGGDIKFAYNANRSPHAVVFPASSGVELAFVANVSFDGVTAADVPSLSFSSEPNDLPFSSTDCVVVRTDQGAVFKIGNSVESGSSVTFNYAAL